MATTTTDTRIAREREAMARAPRVHLEAAEGIDADHMGAEQAEYIPPQLDPQWMIAFKLFTDDEGEYGIPYPVPIGQVTQGANALVNMRRIDGGFAWTAVAPARLSPQGSIECVSERCGDAHLGGRRKMLKSLDALIKHVKAFHPDEAETYSKYFDKIQDDLALANPRLQKLMQTQGIATPAQTQDAAHYCGDDECTRFFDNAAERDKHEKTHKKDGE